MVKSGLLQLENVHAHYGHVHALKGITMEVHKGEIVALLGGNGAGKSTTLNTIVGMVEPSDGKVFINGKDTVGTPVHDIVSMRVAVAPEGRRIFPTLTVYENLLMGAYGGVLDKEEVEETKRSIYELFPVLKERSSQLGSSLSGGEQQMLAIGRALMSGAELLLLDEPSLGLAPLITRDIFRTIRRLAEDRGLTVLLVEQNARQALQIASRAYVMAVGRIVHEGASADVMSDDAIRRAYLG